MAELSTACGDLKERVQVLALETSDQSVRWLCCRTVWGNVQPMTTQTVFARAGVSAPGVQIVLRRQALRMTNALRWRGQHIFITDVRPIGDGHLLVTGALVALSKCVKDVNLPGGGLEFPAVLTEKYLRHDQLEPYATNTITYVLVTPKTIHLTRGALVKVNHVNYEVQLAHVLDETKNEYEIVRTEDL